MKGRQLLIERIEVAGWSLSAAARTLQALEASKVVIAPKTRPLFLP